MKQYLSESDEDNVGTKFQKVLAEDKLNKKINSLYKMKSQMGKRIYF